MFFPFCRFFVFCFSRMSTVQTMVSYVDMPVFQRTFL
jgi:hypothetical protein